MQSENRPFMNMEGYAKTDFSFRDYVERYYKKMMKDPQTLEFVKGEYELQEINVNELLRIIERDKEKTKDTKNNNSISMKSLVKNALGRENIRLDEIDRADRLDTRKLTQENTKEGVDIDDR